MAEFIQVGTRLGPGPKIESEDGFGAFGKPVPFHRRTAALNHLKSMGLTDMDAMFTCVQGMSRQIELDEPYEAMKIGTRYVDLTGTYRILAVLCTAPDPEAQEEQHGKAGRRKSARG